MNEIKELLRQGLLKKGLDAGDKVVESLMRYMELLLEWNQKFNLTAITDPTEIITYHFLDSLSAVDLGLNIEEASIMDVGTGAGFPGLPLKILFPKTSLLLIDSVKKKTLFLNEVVKELKLDNTRVLHIRAEDLDEKYRDNFDFVVSRTVAEMRVLSEYCLPFVKVGGHFIAYKGPSASEEAENAKNAIKVLGGLPPEIRRAEVPYSNKTHNLVIVRKTEKTKKKYPRSAGIPKKSPL